MVKGAGFDNLRAMTTDSKHRLVPMDKSMARSVATLHRSAIDSVLLSALGEAFLCQMYIGIASAQGSGVWVAVDTDRQLAGFIAGTLSLGKCYRQVLIHRALPLISAALPRLLHPVVIKHCIDTVAYPKASAASDATRPGAELLAIGVAQYARRRRVGSSLVATLEDAFRRWGFSGEYCVVAGADDAVAKSFYKAVGFRLQRIIYHHGRKLNEYRKHL